MMIYPDQAQKAGVVFNPPISYSCPNNDGDLYHEMGFEHAGVAWIYHSVPSQPYYSQSGTTAGLPGQTWVEIVHTAWPQDAEATWYYYAPGSAIWVNLGNTKAYNDHPDATQDLLGQPCKIQPGDFKGECELQFAELYTAAVKASLDTFQFLFHTDMPCDGNTRRNLALEIVEVHGPGRMTCSGYGGVMRKSRLRAGWEARSQCECDPNDDIINCKGFGMRR